MKYEKLTFKKPIENENYKEISDFVIKSISQIIDDSIKIGTNRIIINTNLRLGLPMENINKIAGPFIEAWAIETFSNVLEDKNNIYNLINVEAQERLSKSDIILQFRKQYKYEYGITANVDVKATAEDISSSGKSPNITSYVRIRSAYIEEPDFIFIILSLKHKVYSNKNDRTNLIDGIMEIVSHNAYDLKFISAKDIRYNPSLGTGQLQVKDIHYVTIEDRNTWEFCQLLDKKYMASSDNNFEKWYQLAKKFKWIKESD